MNFHALRFDRAAKSYEGTSHIQAEMAETLLGIFPSDQAGYPGKRAILELGCGTGHLTKRLFVRFPGERILATDASPRMLEEARLSLEPWQRAAVDLTRNPGNLKGIIWARMDAEGPVPESVKDGKPYPLIASNALVQWFPDLARHFGLVASLLEPSGHYLVSGFSRSNFPELNAILREPPFNFRQFPGHERQDVEGVAKRAGLGIMDWRERAVEEIFPSPEVFLQRVKGLGAARRPEEGSPLTRKRLKHLVQAYTERHSVGSGIKATWRPWYALIGKPPASEPFSRLDEEGR